MEVFMVLPALDGKQRCRWAATDPVLAAYHDQEWGEPPIDQAGWFERLSLEVFQAGLSWRTVLAKREGFRRAFHDFEPKLVADLGGKDVAQILRDPGIVRNRAKVLATIDNARTVLTLSEGHGSFEQWARSQPDDLGEQQRIYRQTFQFASPQVVEAFLQSVGRTPPPHEPGCWRLPG
jgi:DNA-3-methyladenine glycosylase I